MTYSSLLHIPNKHRRQGTHGLQKIDHRPRTRRMHSRQATDTRRMGSDTRGNRKYPRRNEPGRSESRHPQRNRHPREARRVRVHPSRECAEGSRADGRERSRVARGCHRGISRDDHGRKNRRHRRAYSVAVSRPGESHAAQVHVRPLSRGDAGRWRRQPDRIRD